MAIINKTELLEKDLTFADYMANRSQLSLENVEHSLKKAKVYLDDKGNVVNHEIAETVIHVDKRMTYTSVAKILADRDEEEIEKYKEDQKKDELTLFNN